MLEDRDRQIVDLKQTLRRVRDTLQPVIDFGLVFSFYTKHHFVS